LLITAHEDSAPSATAPAVAQLPPAQTSEHVVPQLPQFISSSSTSMQAPPHTMAPLGQVQVPLRHVAPVAHAVPHAPQWLSSLDV
tara:strand:- start:147 stop:401 length:255 start_codon:yes stop_codon:yes gene_type:complete